MRSIRFHYLTLVAGMILGSELEGQLAKKPGEINTPPAKGERHKDSLKPGDVAPDFTLPLIKERKVVTLSDFKGKKPVVLIFGSYT